MNDRKNGYILLETMFVVLLSSMFILVLYQDIAVSQKTKNKIQNRIELSQQMQEVDFQIRNLLKDARNIISITTKNGTVIRNIEYGNLYSVSSIKINSKLGDETSSAKIKNKEIKFRLSTGKLSIVTLLINNSSGSGGNEIGVYVDDMKFRLDKDKKVCILLEFKKNKENLTHEIIASLN